MSQTTVIDRPPRRWRVREALYTNTAMVVIVGVLSLSVLLVARTAIPDRVDHITVVNPSPYTIQLDARGDGGWVPLTNIRPGETRDIQSVLDLGPTWSVRYAGQGQSIGSVTYDRGQLEGSGWVLTVPADVTDVLRARGAPETPNP